MLEAATVLASAFGCKKIFVLKKIVQGNMFFFGYIPSNVPTNNAKSANLFCIISYNF